MRMVFPSDPVRFFNGLGADVGTLVDQFLDDVQAKPETWRVPVDVFQDAESVRFEIDLPGVSIENLDIQVEDGHLRIQGNRQATATDEGTKTLHRERHFGDFSRRFELPDEVDHDSVDAELADGVLRIHFRKIEKPGAKKIQVRTRSTDPAVDNPAEASASE